MERHSSRRHLRTPTLALALTLLVCGIARAQTLSDVAARIAASRGPTIRALVAPPANAAGWHNTDVAISFDCERAVVCPEGIVLSTDGAGQRVSQSVVDAAGRAAHVELLFNIDKTPGTVTIASTDGLNTDRLIVRAHAQDTLSGISSAMCNGRQARVSNGAIECEVSVRDGMTDVVVSVLDAARNSASAGMQVRRGATSSVVRAFPRTATIRVGDSRPLELADTAWQPLARAWWVSDDPGVVEVDSERGMITGRREGQATIRGILDDGRHAASTVTVIGAAKFPLGTVLWTGHNQPGSTGGRVLPRQGVMMSAEFTQHGDTYVQLLSILGTPEWITLAPIGPDERLVHRMVDDSGAPILWVDNGRGRSAVVRTGQPVEGRVWRYELSNPATGFFALGWDGTLWIVETPGHGYAHVSALDHLTGALKFRVGVPLTLAASATGAAAATARLEAHPSDVGPAYVADGLEVAVPFATTDVALVQRQGKPARFDAIRMVSILRITPEGQARIEGMLGFVEATLAALPKLRLTGVRPDGAGGVLVLMQASYADGRAHGWVMRKDAEKRTLYPLPVAGEYVLGEDQAYTTDGSTMVAFDPVSGKVNWTRRSNDRFFMDFAVRGGGVLVHMNGGRYIFTTDGQLTKSSADPIDAKEP